MSIYFNDKENSIIISMGIFDYNYGPLSENGYLKVCDFAYSEDNQNFTHLMRVETPNQRYAWWTWLNMRYKRAGTQIQFIDCYSPVNGTMWPDNDSDARVEVYTRTQHQSYADAKAYFTVKWFLADTYKGVKAIRVTGFWKVNGLFIGDNFKEVYYKPTSAVSLKSENLNSSHSLINENENTTDAKKNGVIVSKEEDEVVIKDAELGENIKVYNVSGTELKSIVKNNDVVKIKLPKNQIYIVQIGQARYKVIL